MNLTELYNSLYTKSIDNIRNGNNKIDRSIDDKNDKRRGVTVLIRPNDNIQEAIARFHQGLMIVVRGQDYQPGPAQRVRVLCSHSCDEGHTVGLVATAAYVRRVERGARDTVDIGLDFQGISAPPEAVMAQG